MGSGRKEQLVKEKIKELGIQDIFHLMGRFPVEDMPEFYSLASVMLVTLKKEHIFSLTIPAKLQSYLALNSSFRYFLIFFPSTRIPNPGPDGSLAFP